MSSTLEQRLTSRWARALASSIAAAALLSAGCDKKTGPSADPQAWGRVTGHVQVQAGDYAINQDITIEKGAAFELAPGTTLRFAGDAGLVSFGTLTAVGTNSAPITFTAQCQSWDNISLVGEGASSSRLEYCRVTKGAGAPQVNAGNQRCGGGLTIHEADAIVRHCTVEGNRADHGGGVYVYHAQPRIEHSTIANNVATGDGGGLFFDVSRSGKTLISPWAYDGDIAECTFNGNSARRGGGMYLVHARTLIKNCGVEGNRAEVGGGVYLSNATSILRGFTVRGNKAPHGNGIALVNSSASRLLDSRVEDDITHE